MNNKKLLTDQNPSISGIIAGICKGRLWYDDESNPTLAVTYSHCVGGCGVTGEIQDGKEEEAKVFFLRVFEELKAMGISEFEFATEEERLTKKLLSIFASNEIKSEMEYSYRRKKPFTKDCDLTSKYWIVKVTKQLLFQCEDGEMQNKNLLLERVKNSWKNYQDFIDNSIAFVAIENNQIIGIIFGSAKFKENITIDIEVERNFRRQGIATELTKEFVNECANKGLTAQWDHVESNTGSKVLAGACGFQLFKSRPYYWFDI